MLDNYYKNEILSLLPTISEEDAGLIAKYVERKVLSSIDSENLINLDSSSSYVCFVPVKNLSTSMIEKYLREFSSAVNELFAKKGKSNPNMIFIPYNDNMKKSDIIKLNNNKTYLLTFDTNFMTGEQVESYRSKLATDIKSQLKSEDNINVIVIPNHIHGIDFSKKSATECEIIIKNILTSEK